LACGARAGLAPDTAGGRPGVFVLSPSASQGEPPVLRLRVQVLATMPHDNQAFTQGLFWDDGTLYEGTGLYTRSDLRQVDPTTGDVLRRVPLPREVFGEGIAPDGGQIIQITWKEGIAFIWDKSTFEPQGQYQYTGEGWGLCNDGQRLIMSDGSSQLTFRDSATFEPIGSVPVTLEGRPVDELNELECVGDRVYANVWMTDRILRIDPATGRVDATIDASGLLNATDRLGADVLNGIAYEPDDDTFLITGKMWPKLFKVRFVDAASS
jgi:glutaminyl-peptide cyclotransferase